MYLIADRPCRYLLAANLCEAGPSTPAAACGRFAGGAASSRASEVMTLWRYTNLFIIIIIIIIIITLGPLGDETVQRVANASMAGADVWRVLMWQLINASANRPLPAFKTCPQTLYIICLFPTAFVQKNSGFTG